MNVLFGNGVCADRLRAQELCNNCDLRRVHEGRRMADVRKFEQLRARTALGHFLCDRCRQEVRFQAVQQQNGKRIRS